MRMVESENGRTVEGGAGRMMEGGDMRTADFLAHKLCPVADIHPSFHSSSLSLLLTGSYEYMASVWSWKSGLPGSCPLALMLCD